ncbi:MAG: nitrilase-related carbon-nitrogen hydrolase, partial [Pseudomonadota bacterium]
ETSGKAAGMLRVLKGEVSPQPELLTPTVKSLVGPYLFLRNNRLSKFLIHEQVVEEHDELAGKKLVIIDNEDDFAYLQSHIANRIGLETATQTAGLEMTFYGNSFITDHTGELIGHADDHSEAILLASVDLDYCEQYRTEWGVFRDRRPECYATLQTYGGER